MTTSTRVACRLPTMSGPWSPIPPPTTDAPLRRHCRVAPRGRSAVLAQHDGRGRSREDLREQLTAAMRAPPGLVGRALRCGPGTILADAGSAGYRARLALPPGPRIRVADILGCSSRRYADLPAPCRPLTAAHVAPSALRCSSGPHGDDMSSCCIGSVTLPSSSGRTAPCDQMLGSVTRSRRSCSMSDLHAILQLQAAAYGRMRWGVWDLVFPTRAHHPCPPRQHSVAPTPRASGPDRSSLAHGGHDPGGHIWRR